MKSISVVEEYHALKVIQLPRWAWWSHCLWHPSPHWRWWWPAWGRQSSCFSRWGSFRRLEHAATALQVGEPLQLFPVLQLQEEAVIAAWHRPEQQQHNLARLCPSHVSVLQQSSHLWHCHKGNLSPNTFNKWFSYFRLLCMRAQAGNYNLEEYLHLFMWMEGRRSWATTHSGLLLLWCSADNSLETLKEATKSRGLLWWEDEDEEDEDTDDDDLELFHFYDCIGCKAIFRDSWESWSFAACHILWKSLV